MQPRDEAEAIIRSWDAYERNRGSAAIIDYDCFPSSSTVEPAGSRMQVLSRLENLRVSHPKTDHRLRAHLLADITYIRALLGERLSLNDYVSSTQGCPAAGWSDQYIAFREAQARAAVESMGIQWNAHTLTELASREGHLTIEEAPDAIRQAASEFEPTVRKLTGTDAPFNLATESANVDAYWAYWLDGSGQNARLRLNLRHAQFTRTQARVFALHEVMGHALKGASYAAQCAETDVPWVRLLSVHAPQQVLLEGLAQALPLFILPDDMQTTARTRLAHFHQLVMSELHIAINSGVSVSQCFELARARVPYWTDENICNILSDRAVNPQLRSYLWSYAAGIDWFVSLAEDGGSATSSVLKSAYRAPLMPSELEALWPEGPKIGGNMP